MATVLVTEAYHISLVRESARDLMKSARFATFYQHDVGSGDSHKKPSLQSPSVLSRCEDLQVAFSLPRSLALSPPSLSPSLVHNCKTQGEITHRGESGHFTYVYENRQKRDDDVTMTHSTGSILIAGRPGNVSGKKQRLSHETR